jgi:DNA recombination protein RmuC
MDPVTVAILAVVLVLVAGLVWLVVRLDRQVRTLEAPDPTSGLVLMQEQIEALREQLRLSLGEGRSEINQRLDETHRVVGEVRQSLGEVDRQVRSVTAVARDLRGLQEMLRAPKFRGGMGEYLLAELLEQVLPDAHYDLQYEFPGGERVDAVIRIGPRLVPVDAKFPMESFRRLVEADNGEGRKTARRTLRADVKRHVDAIATRYIRLGDETYDFAMMYIPAESVHHEALLADDEEGSDLFRYAIERRVVPVSPQSFYAYLQVILTGLRGLTIERRAQEIMSRLGHVRSRLERFGESFDVGIKHLANAQKQLDEAGRRLARVDDSLIELESHRSGDEEPATIPAGRTEHD